jgi:preprotein translocase subunit SecG
MFTVLLVIHVLVTLALIGVVLIQRSEGGGLGIGGGQGMGSFMTGRGTANLLTRTTAILATVFLALSLLLALMTRNGTTSASAIFDAPPLSTTAPSTTLPAPAPTPAAPSKPAVPATP